MKEKKEYGYATLINLKINEKQKKVETSEFSLTCHCDCGCDCYVTG